MRRADVVRALRDADGAGVSGEALAAALGVSRAAVAKHVSALRALGYVIDARPGEGYRLTSAPDLPLPEEVEPLLTSAVWTSLTGGPETGSTNDDAKALARAGAAEGAVVLAAGQTRGRGRLGRDWRSPAGGVYLSVLLRPPLPPAQLPSLALAVGLGVAFGIEALGARAGVKWPNDVILLNGAGEPLGKVAGVLVETSAEADRVEWVVAGVGVNVCRGAAVPPSAACLDAVLPARPRLARVAAAVLDGVGLAYERYVAGGFPALRAEYETRLTLAGREITVSDAAGRVVAQGRAAGVDGEGRLLLGEPGALVAVTAGEVTLRPPDAAGPASGTD